MHFLIGFFKPCDLHLSEILADPLNAQALYTRNHSRKSLLLDVGEGGNIFLKVNKF